VDPRTPTPILDIAESKSSQLLSNTNSDHQLDKFMEEANYFNIAAEDVVHCLKKRFQYQGICHDISSTQLINATAKNRGLEVSDMDVQQEADRYRHENGLQHAADTIGWLNQQQVAPEEWEEGIRDRLLANQLSGHLFSRDIERFFAENRSNYESVILYQLVVPYEQLAMELFYQIEESEISFYEAAHLYDIDPNRRRKCGFEGILARWQIEPSLSSVIFGAQIQQVTQPIQRDDGYHLIWVEEFLEAILTEAISKEIMDNFFQDWVQSELNHARHL
jgi:parvulin-like peptidyl-prolyl isomerase